MGHVTFLDSSGLKPPTSSISFEKTWHNFWEFARFHKTPEISFQLELKKTWDLKDVTHKPQVINLFWVVVSNIFYFHPYLGKIPIFTNNFP